MVARSRSRSLEAEPLHINRCHLLFPIPCDIPGVLRGESNSAAELIKADEAGIAVRSLEAIKLQLRVQSSSGPVRATLSPVPSAPAQRQCMHGENQALPKGARQSSALAFPCTLRCHAHL